MLKVKANSHLEKQLPSHYELTSINVLGLLNTKETTSIGLSFSKKKSCKLEMIIVSKLIINQT